jgi:hypothetical protein
MQEGGIRQFRRLGEYQKKKCRRIARMRDRRHKAAYAEGKAAFSKSKKISREKRAG